MKGRLPGIGLGVAALSAIGLIALPTAARAETDYTGKTVTVVVAFGAGGAYDLYGRLVARHIGQHLPGKPQVITQNMPGAGGLRGTNYVYNVAPKDGTVLVVPSQTLALGQLLESIRGIRYDARKISWIGRMASVVQTNYSWHTSKVKTIEYALKNQVIAAATGPTSSSTIFPRLLNELAGTKFKVITGYKGTKSIEPALEQGEVEMMVRPWADIKANSPHLLREKKINILMTYTQEREPELKGIPAVVELARNDQDRKILGLFASTGVVGMALGAPPGVPADAVATLRKAFMATVRSDAFKATVKRTRVDIAPLPGETLAGIVNATFDTPADVVDKAKQVYRKITRKAKK